jgi:aspartate/methionine/tyrosine aminotransferase
MIAGLYPGAGPENVLVTVGSSEANFVTSWSLVSAGMRVAIQTPTYKQTWGLAQNLGAQVAGFALDGDRSWTLDHASAEAAITPDTDVVVVTNPNNPTGHIMTGPERETVIGLTRRAGAWLLVDEVYRGAEREADRSDTFWGTGDRVVVVGGLSKAYGLPGLRIGWVVGPDPFISEVAARHDYTVIGASSLSDFLAVRALRTADVLLDRARGIIHSHFETLEQWLSRHADMFSWTPPECGAICFPRYNMDVESFEFVERLRKVHSVLLVPGSHFDCASHLRIGFGYDRSSLQAALTRVSEAITTLAA